MNEMKEWHNGRKRKSFTSKSIESEKTRKKEETSLRQVRKLAIHEIEGELAQTPRFG
jgi:hypothetical protein